MTKTIKLRTLDINPWNKNFSTVSSFKEMTPHDPVAPTLTPWNPLNINDERLVHPNLDFSIIPADVPNDGLHCPCVGFSRGLFPSLNR
jgi:hypothetical protein